MIVTYRTTADRKACLLDVLESGPWPDSTVWMLFHDRYTPLADVNALRTVQALVREGKVVAITEPLTGERLWRLADRAWYASDGYRRLRANGFDDMPADPKGGA
jgi:hypothetical protein